LHASTLNHLQVGLARINCEEASAPRLIETLVPQLSAVQSRLLDVGSAVATPMRSSGEQHLRRAAFDGAHEVAQLEGWIDAMDEDLPELRSFILPSGGAAGATLHLARAICRRAERSVVPLVREGDVDASAGVYLNRLSDYLFVAARFAALHGGHVETPYKKAREV